MFSTYFYHLYWFSFKILLGFQIKDYDLNLYVLYICEVFHLGVSRDVGTYTARKVSVIEIFLIRIFPYSVKLRENKNQKNSQYRHFHAVMIFRDRQTDDILIFLLILSQVRFKNSKYFVEWFFYSILNNVTTFSGK